MHSCRCGCAQGEQPGEVFDELVRRGEVAVHASDVELLQHLARHGADGELVVADTRDQVGRINTLAHQTRQAAGEVTDSVVTAAGERIGVGDRIATRRNDRDADVANRETWTVLACDGGSLRVQGEAGSGVPVAGLRACSRRARLRHHRLRRQGSTVPVTARADRRAPRRTSG